MYVRTLCTNRTGLVDCRRNEKISGTRTKDKLNQVQGLSPSLPIVLQDSLTKDTELQHSNWSSTLFQLGLSQSTKSSESWFSTTARKSLSFTNSQSMVRTIAHIDVLHVSIGRNRMELEHWRAGNWLCVFCWLQRQLASIWKKISVLERCLWISLCKHGSSMYRYKMFIYHGEFSTVADACRSTVQMELQHRFSSPDDAKAKTKWEGHFQHTKLFIQERFFSQSLAATTTT